MLEDGAKQSAGAVLTPRRDRVEASIIGVLRANGTRSSLRTVVLDFADLQHTQGASLPDTIRELEDVVRRAAPEMDGRVAVGESMDDRLALVQRWVSDWFRARVGPRHTANRHPS